jgi:hypothetical protein
MMKSYAPMAAVAKREAMPAEGLLIAQEKKRAKDEEKGRQASLTLADTAVSGNLSKTDVLKALDGQRRRLGSCLDDAKGRLVLQLTVNPDGTVKTVKILSATLSNGKAAQCIVDHLKSIRLPATKDGREGRVAVTIASA